MYKILKRTFTALVSQSPPGMLEYVPIASKAVEFRPDATNEFPEPLVEKGNNKARLWMDKTNTKVKLEVFEDEWDDWPYPHTMQYEINATAVSEGKFYVNNMKYQMAIEDDLFPVTSHSTWIVEQIERHRFDSFKERVPTELTSEIPMKIVDGIVGASKVVVPENSLFVHIERNNYGVLSCRWPRFFRLWEKTRGGTDLYHGITTSRTNFMPAKQNVVSKL